MTKFRSEETRLGTSEQFIIVERYGAYLRYRSESDHVGRGG